MWVTFIKTSNDKHFTRHWPRGQPEVSEQRLYFKSHTLETSGQRTSYVSQKASHKPCPQRPMTKEELMVGAQSSSQRCTGDLSSPPPGPRSKDSRTTLVCTHLLLGSPPALRRRQRALRWMVPHPGAHRPKGPGGPHKHTRPPGAGSSGHELRRASHFQSDNHLPGAPLAGSRSTLLLVPALPAEGSSCEGTAARPRLTRDSYRQDSWPP